jgi:hypothetical protein
VSELPTLVFGSQGRVSTKRFAERKPLTPYVAPSLREMKVMGLFPPAPMPRLHEGVRLGPMLTVNISERSERLESRVRALEVSYSGDDVDDRLGGHTGHRR